MVRKMERKGYETSKFRLGLNGKLLLGIVVPLVVILFILAMIIIKQVSGIVSSVKSDNIENQIHASSVQIEEYFQKFFMSAEFVRDKPYVQQLIMQTENESPDFRFENSELFPYVMQDLKKAHDLQSGSIQAVWLAIVKNNETVQSDGYISNGDYQVTERTWYKMLQANPNKDILTPAYTDASTGKTVVTIATPYTDETGKIIAVVGIDILMDELANYLSTIKIGDKGYVTVYDSNENIVYHPDSSLLMKNLSSIEYSENMKTAMQSNNTTDLMKYQRSSTVFYGAVEYLDDFGWTVLGCMPESEYVHETHFIVGIIAFGFLLCIVILVVICVYRSKKIVKPIQTLNLAAKEFVKGNLDAPIYKTTDDEVGDLTDVFIHTQEGLKSIISDIGYVISELSEKNLTVRPTATYQGSFVQIETALKAVAERMNTVLQVINDTADQVDSGANQVACGAQSLAQGSTEQASSVEELASTINEISQQMQRMSYHAKNASDKANNVGDDVQQSSEKMHLMVEAMERIDKSSNEIQKIIKAIEDIAFQTNILALNAAVEAARAGTAGKGFAVVADEVRNLASKSAEASQTTATLISNSLAAVKDGMLLAKEANDSLELAVSDVQVVAESIHDISGDLQNHSKTMEQLTVGVDQISSVVQTNSATAEESAAASEELSAQATALKQMMSEFIFDKSK